MGAVHEIAGGGSGTVDGAAAAMFAAGIAARSKGKVLWCLTRPDLFFPAIAQAGLHPDRVIFCEGDKEEDVLASMEEGLSFGGLAAVVGELVRLPMVASRRLQLAAEKTGTMGLVVRRWRRQTEASDFGNPTASTTRWRVPVLLHPDEYEQWLHGSFDDALAFQKRTFPPELVTMERTSELWAKKKAAPEAPLLL